MRPTTGERPVRSPRHARIRQAKRRRSAGRLRRLELVRSRRAADRHTGARIRGETERRFPRLAGLCDERRGVPRYEKCGTGLVGRRAPTKRLVLVRLTLSIAVVEHAAPRVFRWRGIVDHLGIELRARQAFPRLIRERVARLSYRSVRGSPKWGKTLVSPNQVIADIRSPSSVRTNNAYARAISDCASGR